MQNKPNFPEAQINANSVYTRSYEYFMLYKGPKTNPKQTQFKPNCRNGEIDAKCVFTKDYRKKDDFKVRINKPNFQNAKNERKLICYR